MEANDTTILEIRPRVDFGAPLEPKGGILHGAGQDHGTWREYTGLMAPHGLAPQLFMVYTGLRGLKGERLDAFKPYWETATGNAPLMQMGLAMTVDGQPGRCYAHEVARGDHDDSIRLLGDWFAREERPVLLRIGYECTGPWNGYEAASYVEAYRRVTTILRAFPFELATVWCVEGGWTHTAEPYYPGDAHVDWISVDLFSPEHFAASEAFAEKAFERRKPLLIGECTPRRVGVLDGEASWERWYRPFFDWISRHRHVKAFSYINWDWSGHEMWRDWGDARVQMNEIVMENWIRQLKLLPR